VEEVEDEDAVPDAGKKKKKKKPKKKKKSAQPEVPASEVTAPISPPVSPPPTPVKASPPPPPVSPIKLSPKKQPPRQESPSVRSPSLGTSSTTTLPNLSTTSLPFPHGQTSAQSARSYLKDLDGPKEKVKSRSDHASIFSSTGEKEKKGGFFSKFSRKDKPVNDQEKKGDKRSWFAKLPKRTERLMHQLLNTSEDDKRGLASMKWEHFVKVIPVGLMGIWRLIFNKPYS
jgi:hypothetical protein